MKKLRTQRVLQEGFITFFEIIKAILMGIVEGITEWLPISSTGHMILVEQVVKFNASEEFMSMFRVVIQLGAILAVVVLSVLREKICLSVSLNTKPVPAFPVMI